MELSPSWETASCAATQELLNILWNPKVLYRVHKSPPLVPIQSQINPVLATPSYLWILSTHLCLGLSGLFHPGCPTNILYAFLLSSQSCYMPHPSHPPWLDHFNYTWRRVQVMTLLTVQCSATFCHFIWKSNAILIFFMHDRTTRWQ
jgi:hypothetical protein